MASVRVARVRRSLLGEYHDPTFPAALYPLITPTEFTASIHRINAACAPSPWMYVSATLPVVLLLVGAIAFVTSAMRVSEVGGPSTPVFAGFATIALGLVLVAVERGLRARVMLGRMRRAVDEENGLWYAGRVPPVSWRVLEDDTQWGWENNAQRRSSWRYSVYVDVGQLPQGEHHHHYQPPVLLSVASAAPPTALPPSYQPALQAPPPPFYQANPQAFTSGYTQL